MSVVCCIPVRNVSVLRTCTPCGKNGTRITRMKWIRTDFFIRDVTHSRAPNIFNTRDLSFYGARGEHGQKNICEYPSRQCSSVSLLPPDSYVPRMWSRLEHIRFAGDGRHNKIVSDARYFIRCKKIFKIVFSEAPDQKNDKRIFVEMFVYAPCGFNSGSFSSCLRNLSNHDRNC